MKDEIRIIFFKQIGFALDGEKLKYLAVKKDDDTYQISEAPNCLYGVFSALTDYLCYDYDDLSMYNQMRYEKYYIQLKRVNVNVYSKQEKTFQKKRKLFT